MEKFCSDRPNNATKYALFTMLLVWSYNLPIWVLEDVHQLIFLLDHRQWWHSWWVDLQFLRMEQLRLLKPITILNYCGVKISVFKIVWILKLLRKSIEYSMFADAHLLRLSERKVTSSGVSLTGGYRRFTTVYFAKCGRLFFPCTVVSVLRIVY